MTALLGQVAAKNKQATGAGTGTDVVAGGRRECSTQRFASSPGNALIRGALRVLDVIAWREAKTVAL
jgi:hypothetical protein